MWIESGIDSSSVHGKLYFSELLAVSEGFIKLMINERISCESKENGAHEKKTNQHNQPHTCLRREEVDDIAYFSEKFAHKKLEVVYRFFALKKVTKDADRRSCGNIMNHMAVSLQHLGKHPQWDVTLSKDDIRCQIIIDDIDIRIVSETFHERPTSTEEDGMSTSEDIEIDLFLSRDRFRMMIDNCRRCYARPRFHGDSFRQYHRSRFFRENALEIGFNPLFIWCNDVLRFSLLFF